MPKGLPKSIIKQYGISKKAWEIYRSRKKKRKVNKTPRTSKPRRKTVTRRRSYRRKRRRRPQKRISIIGTAGAVGSLFVPQGVAGAKSMGYWVQKWITQGKVPNGEIEYMLGDTMGQYIGYNPKLKRWGLPTATLTIIGAGIASKIANKYGGQYLRNLPFIGKYIRF